MSLNEHFDLKSGWHEFNNHELVEIKSEVIKELLDNLRSNSDNTQGNLEILIQVTQELKERSKAS